MKPHPTELAFSPTRERMWFWGCVIAALGCTYPILFSAFTHRLDWQEEPSAALWGYVGKTITMMTRLGGTLAQPSFFATWSSGDIPDVVDLLVRWSALGLACLPPALHMKNWARLTTGRTYGARIVGGPHYYEHYQAIRQLRRMLGSARFGTGSLSLAPGVILPQRLENRTFAVIGLPGGGKSTFINHIALQVWKRRDKLIMTDTSGEVVSHWPGSFFLLNPLNPQSHAWDIAADTVTEIDAREVMGQLIPASESEPHWARGAQEIGVGILKSLQVEHGALWGFAEWRDANELPPLDLQAFATRYHRPARAFLAVEDGEFTKTANSYVTNYGSMMNTVVRPLADGWGDIEHASRISLRRWLGDKTADVRTLILQRAADYAAISEAWLPIVLGIIGGFCASAKLPADEARRIWAILDEFPQLGAAKTFAQLAEVGRKKGLCCIFATQNLPQLEERYGPAGLKNFLDLAAFKILFRLEPGPTTETICTQLIPPSRMVYTPEAEPGSPATEEIATHPVIDSAELAKLEQDPMLGVEGLLVHGGDVYRLLWGYPTMPLQRP